MTKKVVRLQRCKYDKNTLSEWSFSRGGCFQRVATSRGSTVFLMWPFMETGLGKSEDSD